MAMARAIQNEHEDQARLSFIVDNDSQLFFDVQEAKKVSERTVVR